MAIPVLAVIVFGIMLITMPMYKNTQSRLDEVTLATRENLEGARVLRAFGREDDEIAAFDARHAALTRLQMLSGRISALMNPLTYIAINFALVLLIKTGALQVDSGVLTQGQVVALVNYMGQILVELIKLANLIITVSKAVACGRRVDAVLALRPEIVSPQNIEAPAPDAVGTVEFDHVSLRYNDGMDSSLSDIHFSARRGQIIGIIGGTGAGKSTLINLIPRFLDASDGAVRVDGVDVRRQDLAELRRRIGVVPAEGAPV